MLSDVPTIAPFPSFRNKYLLIFQGGKMPGDIQNIPKVPVALHPDKLIEVLAMIYREWESQDPVDGVQPANSAEAIVAFVICELGDMGLLSGDADELLAAASCGYCQR
jgi:hypothetical protein